MDKIRLDRIASDVYQSRMGMSWQEEAEISVEIALHIAKKVDEACAAPTQDAASCSPEDLFHSPRLGFLALRDFRDVPEVKTLVEAVKGLEALHYYTPQSGAADCAGIDVDVFRAVKDALKPFLTEVSDGE